MTESDVGGKRWASRAIVQMLLKEGKNYKGAAEVVSGAKNVFATCGQNIRAKVEEVEQERSVASSFALQQILEEAHHEIAGHRAWQEEVISALPKEDDEAGLTGPLRLAFTETSEAREELLTEVTDTYEKYFSKS